MYKNFYYIQTNVICLIILSIILLLSYKKQNTSSSSLSFHNICILTSFLCVFDIVFRLSNGQFFLGAKETIELFNVLRLEFFLIICYFWQKFVYLKFGKKSDKNQRINIYLIILIIMSTLIFLNHWTNFFFYINNRNLSIRNVGAVLYFILSFIFIITPVTKIMIENSQNKTNYFSNNYLILCVIPPIISIIFQFLVDKLSLYQVGITLSVLFIFLKQQNEKITKDELTRLNNRYELKHYLNEMMSAKKDEEYITVFMIDANNFKQINDKYGHVIGDKALIEISASIKKACKNQKTNLFASRYGGDEFVIVGINLESNEIIQFNNDINQELELLNKKGDNPYKLSVSIGTTTMKKSDIKSIDEIINKADLCMYQKKRSQR